MFGCAAALAVAGCGNVATVSQAYYDSSFTSSELGYAAGFGPVPVVVVGNPIAGDRDNRAIIEAMNGRRWDGIRFVPASGPVGNGYSMVLVFGKGDSGTNFCGTPAIAASAAAGGPLITGTFCLGGRLRSQAVASVGPTRDPRDPEFNAALNGLVGALYAPDTDPTKRRPATAVQADPIIEPR